MFTDGLHQPSTTNIYLYGLNTETKIDAQVRRQSTHDSARMTRQTRQTQTQRQARPLPSCNAPAPGMVAAGDAVAAASDDCTVRRCSTRADSAPTALAISITAAVLPSKPLAPPWSPPTRESPPPNAAVGVMSTGVAAGGTGVGTTLSLSATVDAGDRDECGDALSAALRAFRSSSAAAEI